MHAIIVPSFDTHTILSTPLSLPIALVLVFDASHTPRVTSALARRTEMMFGG